MKPYIFLFLSLSLAWTSCFQDCTPQDVKVGDIALTSSSKAFIQQFGSKKVIFKNETGLEIEFKNATQGVFGRDSSKIPVRRNCYAGLTGKLQSWDFMITEGLSVGLQSDSFYLSYGTRMSQDPVGIKSDTNNLYETMYFSAGSMDTTWCISTVAIFSDRGFPARSKRDTSDTYRLFREVRDTTIGKKRLQNINFKKELNKICTSGVKPTNQTPVEFFFNFKQGITAFKTLDGVFWFFDRIE
jgi:hypothetical protein